MLLYPKHVKSRDRAGPAERAGICYGQSVTTVVFEYIRHEVSPRTVHGETFFGGVRAARRSVSLDKGHLVFAIHEKRRRSPGTRF
tara:strand:- start:119 stop:373 length:255 start_codon:yes stop_codon:yes gene_type:complete